ncbi:MAG: DNA-binding protein [Opitutus sp.]|nr:DNA-binding protein [Opitutus sp.]
MFDSKKLDPATAGNPIVLTTSEVAAVLRCTPRHVQALVSRRVLKPVRLGRSVRFLHRSVLNSLTTLEAKNGY